MKLLLLSFITPFFLAGLVYAQSAKPVNALDIATYFPIRQGDAWTYDWQSRSGRGAPQTVKRTRAFEGREFVNTGNVDKLASENGDYVLFSLNAEGLFLHGVAEYQRDARFLFDPPIAVLTRQMEVGKPLAQTQLAEDGKTPRQFTSLLEGTAAIETPLGKFADCLKVTWTMADESAYQKTTYFLAKGVGIVAYQIEVKAKKPAEFEFNVDARLRLVQLQGKTFSRLEDLQLFAGVRSGEVESARARSLLRKVHEALYTWDKKFPGFEADFTMKRAEDAPAVTGTIRVNRQLQIEVQCADATARATVHAEVSQFVSYRQNRPFEELYGAGKARVGLGESQGATVEIIISNEESAGASFLLRGEEIIRVARSYGRVRFINQIKNLKVDDGRFIAHAAELTYYSNESGAVASQISYDDRYEKVGNYWLLRERKKSDTVKGKTAMLELSLQNVRYLK
jgi:hypothetical protein